jgi:uncharacterized SAM-binding protein YcdF (DUF218 family)
MYDDYEFDGKDSGASTIVGVLILCGVILGGAFGLIYYLQGPFAGRQFLSAISAPIGIIWMVFFIAAMTATFSKQRFLATLLWISMIGLSLVGNRNVANNLLSGLESAYRPAVLEEMDTFQYGFVLGGGANVAQNRQLNLNESGERVTEAIRLYKAGKIKHLVFTGSPFLYAEDEQIEKASASGELIGPVATPASPDATGFEATTDGGSTESDGAEVGTDAEAVRSGLGPFVPQDEDVAAQAAESPAPSADEASVSNAEAPAEGNRMLHAYEDAMRQLLAANGVPVEDYSFLGGRYTQEEMLRIDEFLRDKAAARNALITSAFHMPRANRLALKQGLDLQSVAVDFRSGTVEDDPVFFIPKIGDIVTSSAALKEYLAAWTQ